MAIPVLLYHAVPQVADGSDPLAVPRELFLAHLAVIVESERTPITIGGLAAGLRGECPLPERPVAITFDDAYADTAEAVDLVRDRGLSASVFVTTGQVGSEAMIDHGQLAALAGHPARVELGAHTVSHPFLDELGASEIEREVSESKAQLEALIGREVETFAYPYGAYDRDVRAAVIAAGYSSAAAVKNALSHPADDPWAIARWTVRGNTDARRLARILEGRGAPRAWREERLRTRAYRAARRFGRRFGQPKGRG